MKTKSFAKSILRQVASGKLTLSQAVNAADNVGRTVIAWYDPEGAFSNGAPNVLVNNTSYSLAEWELVRDRYQKVCNLVEIEFVETELPLTDQDEEQEARNPF